MGLIHFLDDLTNRRRLELGKGAWAMRVGERKLDEVLAAGVGLPEVRAFVQEVWRVSFDNDGAEVAREVAEQLVVFAREAGWRVALHDDAEDGEGDSWPVVWSRYGEEGPPSS